MLFRHKNVLKIFFRRKTFFFHFLGSGTPNIFIFPEFTLNVKCSNLKFKKYLQVK